MNLQMNQCKTCGGDLHRVGNHYVCQACGNKWTIDAADDVHVVDRANAWAALRDGEFDHAAELFEIIHEKQPDDHEAYWGMALAWAGVVYVVDYVEHKRVPTCNNIDDTSFLNSKEVKKAIELAPSEISSGYRQQAEQIEQIRQEWLQKARKEKPYDVFISYKDSDRENGIDRTQDSYDAQELYQLLVNEGFRVFFSRVSLHDKVSEHYEPYIYNAIKTAKVMIVFGEKPEYFNATWVRNEWSRFRRRMENGEKDRNSLVVVTKNMNRSDVPVALRSRQALSADEMNFSTNLISHIRPIIEAARSNEHVKRRGVESGMKGWKSKTIAQNTISKRELGAQGVETNIDEKKALSVVETFIKEKQWEEANEMLNSMLAANPSFAEAVWCQLLIRHKASSNTVLMRMLDRFKPEDYALVEKALDCAGKEFAGRILDLFYQSAKILPVQVRQKVYDMILPYRYEHRTQQLKENFNWSISNRDFSLFKLLLSALEQNDVDAYIEYNSRYIQATLDHQEKRECTENILAVDEGNRVARMYLFETALSTSDKLEPMIQAFENVLKYSENIDADVEDALVMTAGMLNSPVHCEFARQLPSYYTGDLKTLRRSLMSVGTRMREKAYFEPAQYFFTLLVSLDEQDADAYWGLCLAKIHAATEEQIVLSSILLKDQAEYTRFLSLVEGERRVHCMRLAKTQQNAQKTKRRKRTRILVSTAAAIVLVAGAVLTMTVILPNAQMNKANKLFAEGNYAAASELYQQLGGYDDSTRRAEAVKAILQVQASNHAQAVETLLAQGIPVEITYKAEGGLLGGTEALALGHTLSTDGSIIPTGTETPADGVGEMTKTYNSAAEFASLMTPVMTGYRFAGWVTDSFAYDMGGADPVFHMSLKATWEMQTYAINYELDGGTLLGTSPVEYTITSGDIAVPAAEKDGFTFKGWLCDGETEPRMEVVIPAGSHGNKTFRAQWEGQSYTVTLDYGYAEGGEKKIQIQCGSQLELPVPERIGYVFQGWWENEITPLENQLWERREDVSAKAAWKEVSYSIYYHLNGGSQSDSFKTEYKVTDAFTLEAPTRNGYTFVGWSTTADGSNLVTEVKAGSTENLELYAIWSVQTPTVTLDGAEGTWQNANGDTVETETMTVTFGQPMNLPTPTRGGYIFGGWMLDQTVQGNICSFTRDCTLTAKWVAITYTITYDLQGGKHPSSYLASYSADDSEEDRKLMPPTRVGHVFRGWTYSGQNVPKKEMTITDELLGLREFKAHWELATPEITLKLDADGDVYHTIEATYGQELGLPSDPIRDGHTFLGWYTDGDNSAQVTAGLCRLEQDTVLIAKWEKVNYPIVYDLAGGQNHADNPSTFTCDDTVTLKAPEREGYDFTGWTVNGEGEPVMSPVIPKGTLANQSVVANWVAKTTEITLDADGGSVSPPVYQATYDTDYELPTPTRTGYHFLGWVLNETTVDGTGNWNRTDEALTLVAQWEAKVYTVTLQNIRDYTCIATLHDNYLGGDIRTVIFSSDEPMQYPLPAERPGYVFAGWFTDAACSSGACFDFTEDLTACVTLYAKWVETVDECNGMIPLNGSSGELDMVPGNEFFYAFVIPQDGQVTIFTQNHDGGDPWLEIYDANMNPLDGRHNAGESGDEDAEITWDAEGGQVYYVKVGSYIEGVVSIHLETNFSIDGGIAGIDGKEGYYYETGAEVTLQITYGEDLELDDPRWEGHTFIGWVVEGNESQEVHSGEPWALDSDVTLVAIWD